MAVQGKYPSNALTPDLRTQMYGLEALVKFAGCEADESNMTSITPPSKKRAREVEVSSPIMVSQQTCLNLNPWQLVQPNVAILSPTKMQSRLNGHSYASTSGRGTNAPLMMPYLSNQSDDLDIIVRQHMDQLRSALLEANKRQCRTLLSVAQQSAMKRIREKEVEVMIANKRKKELEEKVRQLAAERQLWFDMAKRNEEMVCSLTTAIEQVNQPSMAQADEGFDESEGVVHPVIDDAESCCYGEEDVIHRNACRSCGEGEVRVLLLPCRHFCLCKDCESMINTCPVCNSTKNASLSIADA